MAVDPTLRTTPRRAGPRVPRLAWIALIVSAAAAAWAGAVWGVEFVIRANQTGV